MKLFWLLLLLMCSLNASAVDVVIHNLDALTTKGQKTVATWVNQSLKKTLWILFIIRFGSAHE